MKLFALCAAGFMMRPRVIPSTALLPAPSLLICPRISSAPCAGLTRTSSLPSKSPGSGGIPGIIRKIVFAFDRQVKRLWNPVDFLAIYIAAQAAIKD